MKFIEVHTYSTDKPRLINVNWIEEVIKADEGCIIYFAFITPNSIEQDYFNVKESYEEVVKMIKE